VAGCFGPQFGWCGGGSHVVIMGRSVGGMQ
jgi:hypothetical protein